MSVNGLGSRVANPEMKSSTTLILTIFHIFSAKTLNEFVLFTKYEFSGE